MNFFDIGTIGRDPEVKTLESGKKVANFSIATQAYKDAPTVWHDVTAWDKLAEVVEKHFHKGDRIYIQGTYMNRQWEDKDGNKRTSYYVNLDGFKFAGSKNKPNEPKSGQSQSESVQIDNEPSDLPF